MFVERVTREQMKMFLETFACCSEQPCRDDQACLPCRQGILRLSVRAYQRCACSKGCGMQTYCREELRDQISGRYEGRAGKRFA